MAEKTVSGKRITLRELKREISEHFYNEAKIMDDMIEAHLSKEEMRKLLEFMKNHPFSKLCQIIQDLKVQHDEDEAEKELISASAEK